MLRGLAIIVALLATSAMAQAEPVTLAPTALDRLSAGGAVELRPSHRDHGIVVQRVGRKLWRKLQRRLRRGRAGGAAWVALPTRQAARLGLAGKADRQVWIVGPKGQTMALASATGDHVRVAVQAGGATTSSHAWSQSTSVSRK